MYYAIITPTFIGHFQFIDNYLKSFEKYVVDKNNIPIYFTISKNENKKFQKIISKYKKTCKINVLFIEDLFLENNIEETPDEYLAKYGRFTFQTAKKFYTMLHVNAEKFLVLDCESMWVKKTNMTQVFEEYFNNPCIYTCEIIEKTRNDTLFNQMLKNINYLTNSKPQKWYIENFKWFYDKQILVNMFKELGDFETLLNRLVQKNKDLTYYPDIKYGIFEIVLYYQYLYLNKEKYNYTEISIDNLLSQNLSKTIIDEYSKAFYNHFGGSCGVLEHAMLFLNKENYLPLAKLFKENNFNIIRCDYTDFKNFELQNRFLKIVQPNILAASQNHCFGINNDLIHILKINKQYLKLKKHINNFIKPKTTFLKRFFESISILSYLLKFLLNIPKVVILYSKHNK